MAVAPQITIKPETFGDWLDMVSWKAAIGHVVDRVKTVKPAVVGTAMITIAGFMAVTNPGKDAYVDYAVAKFATDFQHTICQGPTLPKTLAHLGSFTKNLCQFSVRVGYVWQRSLVKDVVDSTTRRQNFIVFSIYTTEIPGQTFQTLGMLGNFLTYRKG